jgi:para-aminobenzoate synthetase / 4-amino-4-deoxychorismate lyase
MASQSYALLSRLSRRPGFALLRDGEAWRVYKNPAKILVATDPESLQQCLIRVENHVNAGGEAVGVLSYEAGYALEPRVERLLPRSHERLAWFGLYRESALQKGIAFPSDPGRSLLQNSRLSISRRRYYDKIAAIRRLIEAGDVYQINFTTRVKLTASLGAWELFASLFNRHPAPYAAFVNTGKEQIVSLSPEMFFELDKERIVVRPMKGTAPRGKLLEDDILAAEQLQKSEKNRSENVMIVDLMRNDLGRICRSGSVRTTSLFDVERYPSVWQMTSTIEGKLKNDCNLDSIVRALFPSGSVTGAPKIRAMELIAGLEGAPRGVYTGSVGYFAPGHARFNVAIRTVELRGKSGVMGVGGGITHDSSAQEEWDECRWKAAFLLQSEPEFKLIETFYWERGYRFLRAHTARLKDSAEYFDFRFSEEKLRSALQKAAKWFPRTAQRVRLLLSRNGELEITHADYSTQRFGRAGISARRTSSGDRFLYHKTTNRRMYEQELAAARKRGFDDVLFFNEKGELTEGTIHNVFVVKDGVWRTPPVECGLLPGIFRADILKKHENSCEAILSLNDLKNADAVYLCNSVRGAFEVSVQRR